MSQPTYLRDVIPTWVIDDDPTPHGHTLLQQQHVRRAAYLLCSGDSVEDDPRCNEITAQELAVASTIHQASYHRFKYTGDLGFKIVNWLAIMGGDMMEEHAQRQKEWNAKYGPKGEKDREGTEKPRKAEETDNGTKSKQGAERVQREESEECSEESRNKRSQEFVKQSGNAVQADDGPRRSRRLAKPVQEAQMVVAHSERSKVKREEDDGDESLDRSECKDVLESLD